MSPALLLCSVCLPSGLSMRSFEGAYSALWSTLLNLQYPNSIMRVSKLSTDKVNTSPEQTCAADTKAHFGTKEYVNREKEISCPLESSRNPQFAKFCPLLSREQRSIHLPHVRAVWGWAGAGQGRAGLRACPRTRHKTIISHQNKPRAGEFVWVAMHRILQYLAISLLGRLLSLAIPLRRGVPVWVPVNSWRSDLPLSF